VKLRSSTPFLAYDTHWTTPFFMTPETRILRSAGRSLKETLVHDDGTAGKGMILLLYDCSRQATGKITRVH
jgi:hypothetical protein